MIYTDALRSVLLPYMVDGWRPVPKGGCHLPGRSLNVDHKGDVFPCYFMLEQSMGNVRDGVRLRDIWHGPVQMKMQDRGLTGNCPGCLAACSDVASYNAASG